MIPILLAVGFVAGLFQRGWLFIPVAAVGWPIALILTDVDSGVGFFLAAALVGALNATVGVAVGAGIRSLIGRIRAKSGAVPPSAT